MSLAIFCGCTARFVSDLVGNPEDRFSDVAAYLIKVQYLKWGKFYSGFVFARSISHFK